MVDIGPPPTCAIGLNLEICHLRNLSNIHRNCPIVTQHVHSISRCLFFLRFKCNRTVLYSTVPVCCTLSRSTGAAQYLDLQRWLDIAEVQYGIVQRSTLVELALLRSGNCGGRLNSSYARTGKLANYLELSSFVIHTCLKTAEQYHR